MPFERATIEIKPASTGTGIKASLKKVRGASAKLSLTISGAVGKDLGWADGDGIEVLIGTGSDHGLLRLRKNNSTAQVHIKERNAVRGGSYLTLALGRQEQFIDEKHPGLWCQWEKVDGWIEVVLPRWADMTAPNRKPQTIPERQPAPVRRGTDVTAQLMGDPPPERSALAKQKA